MARNGSGSYSLPEAAFVYDTVIDEVAVNNNFSDIASALTGSIAADGQTTITANLPMSGYRHTGVGNGSARNHYAAIGQIQDGGLSNAGTAGGTADALTVSLTPAITAYATGMRFWFTASADNTGADPTINVNSVGVKTLKDSEGASFAAGYIENGARYLAFYDGTDVLIQKEVVPISGPASTTENNVPQWDSTTRQLKDGLTVGTSAGNLVQLNGSAELPAVSGANLTNLVVVDATARDMAAAALAAQLIISDLSAEGLVGEFANLKLVDDFSSDSLATSTGAAYSAANDWYSNEGSDLTSGETFSASSAAQAVSRAFDDSQSTCWSSNSDNTAYVQVQFASGVAINKLTLKSGTDGFGGVTASQQRERHPNAFTLKASNTGAFAGEETTLYTESASFTWATGANESRDFTFANTTTYTYYRLDMTGKQVAFGDTYEYHLGEMELASEGQDMTLRPTAVTITTGAQDTLGYFLYDPVDSVTLNTDLVAKSSIDGGSTWETGTLTSLGQMGTTGIYLLKAEADVSGQSGTSLSYSLESANSKTLRYAGCVGVVPLY